ncbi:MAG: T9SS type A sorting domain-containing protein [Candidatus Aegiribacteria sp.]|nr:T9SS type A sorting domain-containing protein [Candidatus Aegiribacteria sp.]
MYFRLIVILTAGFFILSGVSAEIFELVNDYDITASDIRSADFNNDGLEDFAVVENIAGDGYYEVFLSNGDCSFTRPGAVLVDTAGVIQLLIGDFIEDGNADLLIMNSDRDTWLYAGDGDGYFSEAATYSWAVHNGCAADLNNDGHLDVTGVPIDLWVYPYGDTVLVMLGDGAGGFTEGWVYTDWVYGYIFCSCQFAYLGDPDIDTILDMCVPCYAGFLVFQGVGDGTFSDPEHYTVNHPFGAVSQKYCTFGDFDEDGYNDIAITGEASMSPPSTYIFLNQQDGTFVQEPYNDGYFEGAGPEQIATADLDLDGHLDLSVAGGGSISGYGDGTFNGEWSEYLSYHPGGEFVFMDMDLDGDMDLADWWGRIFTNTTTQGCEEGASDPFTGLRLSATPNPFSSMVNIEVSDYQGSDCILQIFDLSGRLVNELEPVIGDEEAVFMWYGITSGGSYLPSGIYTARLSSGINTTSLTLLKLSN